MKYTILINQAGVVNVGLEDKTDVVDWALLDYIFSWQQNPNAQVVDGKTWLNYKHLISEMPLLGLNGKGAVANRIKKLSELGLIDTFQSPIDKRLFAKTTVLYYTASQFRGVHQNEQGVHQNEQGVHQNEQGVHQNEQGVHQNEHSYNHQDSLISIHKEILNEELSISTNSSGGLSSTAQKTDLKGEQHENEKSEKATLDEGHRKKFTAPSVTEVESYALDAGITLDATHFVDYFESNGWCVGRNKMKDWKAAARNWARREMKPRTGGTHAGNSKSNEKLCPADRIKHKAMLRKLEAERAERERNAPTHDDNAIPLTDYHIHTNNG